MMNRFSPDHHLKFLPGAARFLRAVPAFATETETASADGTEVDGEVGIDGRRSRTVREENAVQYESARRNRPTPVVLPSFL